MIILFCYQFFINDSPKLNQEISLQGKSPYNGNLILINKDFKLQQEPTNLTIIPKGLTENVLIDSEYKVQQSLIEPLKQMFEAAKKTIFNISKSIVHIEAANYSNNFTNKRVLNMHCLLVLVNIKLDYRLILVLPKGLCIKRWKANG